MKPFRHLGILLLASTLHAQTSTQASANAGTSPAPAPFAIVSRDANSALWQQQTFQQGPKGTVVTNVNQYTELATGLNFKNPQTGQWQPSSENISISPDGNSASAIKGQHQAYFPGDIYNGQIKLVTPDGNTLLNQPIALAFFDGSNSVLLAVTTNSTGAILPSGNQVIYTNAFAGLDADLLYTYTKAGFEQDVILKQQPPDPVPLGLNPQTTRLQLLTEFFNPPLPNVIATTVPTAAGNLEDDGLNFGAMQMGRGKAFLIGSNPPLADVNKQWLTLGGRQFLIEEVPIISIASAIDTLPPFVARSGAGAKTVASRTLVPPPQRLIRTSPTESFQAQAVLPKNGLVVDYLILNVSTNSFTFQGDTTYYISGPVTLGGTNTFEGGTVIKYTNNASITLNYGALNWLASPYRPVILTARDDDTVGETISGSTGNPANYYAKPALGIIETAFNQPISNFRIVYAQQAVSFLSGGVYHFNDGQIVDCQNGFYDQSAASGVLRNMLFCGVQTNFNNLENSSFDVQNVTFSSSSNLTTGVGIPYESITFNFTNCIFANITALTNNPSGSLLYQLFGMTNGFYGCPPFGTGQITNISNPFQTVGAGSCYLTYGCNFLSQGTTNIDPVLLADLQTRTTHPPALVYTNVTTNGTWTPQVQRDTNAAPDLGYHYAPIDYAVSGVNINGTLTLANGVAVASFQSVYSGSVATGFKVGSGDQLTSLGTALVHNQICHYAAIQEQPFLWGGNPFKYAVTVVAWSGASPAVLYARFTDFNGLAGLGASAVFEEVGVTGPKIGGGDPIEFNLRDCRVGPGWLACVTYQGTDTNLCFNNLFDRGGIMISDFDGDSPVTMQNNLVHNGYVTFDNEIQTYTWTVENNFFDNTTLSPGSGGLSEDHNGYWNTTQLTPTNSNDVVVTNFIYATGPLGNYYQVSTNLLNAGSTTADLLGLYHYTVQTNEVVEAANTVSIGFHYVATDAYGNPLDSNGDGIPDYLEDPNGNGIFDTGEPGDWQGLNLNVIITRPRSGSIIP